MTLQEILQDQGLTDEQIKSITNAMKQNKVYVASEENLDIRYSKLKADHEALTNQHHEATRLISQLKSGTRDQEELQGKIAAYETQVKTLQQALAQTQLDAAIKVALMGAKAIDPDYLAFKLREAGELELDDHGQIKGIDERLSALRTQYPTQFETPSAQLEIQAHRLPAHDAAGSGISKAEFLRKPYAERAAFAAQNPEAYSDLMKG
jgi:seryl-tRNA synthetase